MTSLSRAWDQSWTGRTVHHIDSGCRSSFSRSRLASTWQIPDSPAAINDSTVIETLAGVFREPSKPTVGLGLAVAIPVAIWLDAWTAMSIASLLLILVALGRALPGHLVGVTLLSMALSPKVQAGPLFFRFDDLAVLALLIVGLHQMNGKRVRLTGIDVPLLGFTILMWFATSLGLFRGTVGDPVRSLLYLGKLSEYLVAFYATWIVLHPASPVTPDRDSPALRYAWFGMIATMLLLSVTSVAFFITREAGPFWVIGAMIASTLRFGASRSAWGWAAAAVGLTALIGWGEYGWWLVQGRPAPDTEYFRIFSNTLWIRESNHFGGFLALGAVIAWAQVLRGRDAGVRVAAFLLVVLAVGALQMTLSRGAFVALIGGLTVTTLIGRPTALVCAGGLLLLALLAAPSAFSERINLASEEWDDYVWSQEAVEAGYDPAFTFSRNRFEVWQRVLEEGSITPVLGAGIGARHRVFYESSLIQIWAETGVFGSFMFLWLLFMLPRLGHAGRTRERGDALT
jgi:hypothetical protein